MILSYKSNYILIWKNYHISANTNWSTTYTFKYIQWAWAVLGPCTSKI